MRISSAGSTSKSRNAKRFLITQKGERRVTLNGSVGLRQVPIRKPSIYGCAQVAGHCTLSYRPSRVHYREAFGRYKAGLGGLYEKDSDRNRGVAWNRPHRRQATGTGRFRRGSELPQQRQRG